MTVKVLFFGELKERFGKAEDILTVTDNLRVRDILPHFMPSLDQQQAWHGQILYAVNQVQVAADHTVRDGDEVAFMPPMTGG